MLTPINDQLVVVDNIVPAQVRRFAVNHTLEFAL